MTKSPLISAIARLIPVAGTAVVFALVFRRVDIAGVLKSMQTIKLSHLAAALFVSTLIVIALDVEKWRLCLKYAGVRLTRRQALFIRLGSLPIKVFAPFKLGEMARAVYLNRRFNAPLEVGLATIFYDKMLNLLAILIILGAAGLFVKTPYVPAWIFLLALLFFVPPVRRLIAGAARFLPGGLAAPSLRAFAFFDAIPPGALCLFIAMSLTFELSIITITWLIFTGLGLNSVPVAEIFVNVPFIELLATIPVSVSGLGVREGAFVVLFARRGTPAELLAAGLMVTFVKLLFPLIVGLPMTRAFIKNMIETAGASRKSPHGAEASA